MKIIDYNNIMEIEISKSEKKRQAKRFELVAEELAALSDRELQQLECEPELKNEILAVRGLKTGARKRQLKYLGRLLRDELPDGVYEFLEELKGSKLKMNKEFHDLEKLRDRIVADADANHDRAVDAFEDDVADGSGRALLSASLLADLAIRFPDLDLHELQATANRYARSGKVANRREIFRLLKAAAERAAFRDKINREK